MILPSVSLVVLNWNGREFLDTCLDSLEQLDYPKDRLELVLCDNGSTDGSVEYVRRRHPGFRVVALDRNYGFADGNNRGVNEATGDWVGFLNNDMEVPVDWLQRLLTPLETRPDLACLASRIVSWDGGAIDFIGGGVNFQGHGLQLDHDAPSSSHDVARPLLFACGGAMLIRRKLFLEVGGFDPAYFAFFEDVDLGWRLNLLGHDVWYDPAATVRHRHHGTARRIPPHQLKLLSERNALYTIIKNYDDANLALVLPIALMLLNEKALLTAGVDTKRFRVETARTPGKPPPSPHIRRPSALARVRQRGLAGAGKAAIRRLRRAASALTNAPEPPVNSTAPGDGMPDSALSLLVAISETAHGMEALMEKRRWVQSRRRRSDAEVLRLGGVLLEDPTFGHAGYLDFQHWLARIAGIDGAFESVKM
jgi:GT2 family glycosyltransferase